MDRDEADEVAPRRLLLGPRTRCSGPSRCGDCGGGGAHGRCRGAVIQQGWARVRKGNVGRGDGAGGTKRAGGGAGEGCKGFVEQAEDMAADPEDIPRIRRVVDWIVRDHLLWVHEGG